MKLKVNIRYDDTAPTVEAERHIANFLKGIITTCDLGSVLSNDQVIEYAGESYKIERIHWKIDSDNFDDSILFIELV